MINNVNFVSSSKLVDQHNTEKPLITIITAIYNLYKNKRIEYFRQMMSSVKNQTYGREYIEHIIIDGGSKDGTVELLKEYEKAGDIDYWVSEPDNGIYHAMNKGILASHGVYLNFMNSDDYFTNDAIEKSVQYLLESDADFCSGEYINLDKHNRTPIPVPYYHQKNVDWSFLLMPFCHQTMYINRRSFQKIGLYDEDYRSIGDWDFVLRLCISKSKYTYVPHITAYYHFDPFGLANAQVHRIDIQKFIKKYYHSLNLTSIDIKYIWYFAELQDALKKGDTSNLLHGYNFKFRWNSGVISKLEDLKRRLTLKSSDSIAKYVFNSFIKDILNSNLYNNNHPKQFSVDLKEFIIHKLETVLIKLNLYIPVWNFYRRIVPLKKKINENLI